MWNLSNLAAKAQEAAAKAQEAAARIERQLDSSVGIEDTGGAPVAPVAAAASAQSSLSVAHEDFDDDDDFFADSHGDAGVGGWQRPRQDVAEEPATSQPVATKLDVSADEGDDFFGDEDSSPAAQQIVDQKIQNGDEEVDLGDDGMQDGWDGPDDIPLDDEDLFDDVPVDQEEEQPQPKLESLQEIQTDGLPEHESDSVMTSQESDEANGNQAHDVSPDTPIDKNIGPSPGDTHEVESVGMKEAESSAFQDEHPKSNNAEAFAEPNGLEDVEQIDTQELAGQGHENKAENIVSLPPSTNSISESQSNASTTPSMDDAEKQQFLATIAELESQLYQRESQLASKSDQITSLSLQHEAETSALRQTIAETKDEAKKRIVRAKERLEDMQTKLSDAVRRADAAGGSSAEQSDIIAALRAEGEQLARKQSTMEQSVRNAKGEARELKEKLDMETEARVKEVAKVEALEAEAKNLKEDLSSARRGESRSEKLEGELVAAKEESEKQRASNLVLEQQLKELKDETKSLKKEVEEARAGAAIELEGESNKLRKERDDMLGDLEGKLRTSEREANVREDALRHEVSELRKRWQDAVRRAEDLSMDVQHSTAPLLRQLESTERQSRARATAWVELETKLRSDLEEHVIGLEKLTKERNDLIASDKRSRRLLKEKEEEVASSLETIDTLSTTIETLEHKVGELEEEGKRIKQELVLAERKASEGASKVRNEMLQTVVDSEQRYQSQIDALEEELEGERERRSNIESQLDALAEGVAATEFAQPAQLSPPKEKKLCSAIDQASILHDTLVGFDSDGDEEQGDEDGINISNGDRGGSFAAMEQLSLGLKGAKVELEALRKQLASSEETRESLVEELGEARGAVEKLPLFEQKVSDLTMEVKLKEMEIQGLQEDIVDVRFLYRTQLDALLEEKVVLSPSTSSPPSMPLKEEKDKLQAVLRIEDD